MLDTRLASSPAGPIDVSGITEHAHDEIHNEPATNMQDDEGAESDGQGKAGNEYARGNKSAETFVIQPELSESDALLLFSGEADQQGEPEQLDETEPSANERSEPETDPSKLIAAE